jgi:hypothetical protein
LMICASRIKCYMTRWLLFRDRGQVSVDLGFCSYGEGNISLWC